MAVVPCLDMVIAWNDGAPHAVDQLLYKLYEAASAVPGRLPRPVGPVLRLSKPDAGTVRLDWSQDPSAPRGSGEHYHVLRGTDPSALDLAPGTHPHTTAEFSESIPGPLVFYRVVAASACEQVGED